RAMAGYLGVGVTVDAFRAALRIPNMLQNLLGEGTLSASFIPTYSKLLERDEQEAGRVAGAVGGLLALIAGVMAVAGVVFAPGLATVLTPGFEGERLRLTVTLMRVLTPGVAFLVLSAWCLGVLNSHRRFFLPYVAPVLWNVAQIAVLVGAGLWGLGQSSMAVALAWGVFAGGLLQFLVQLPAVASVSRALRLSLRTDLPGVRAVVRQFVPVVIGRGVVQLSGYIELLLASLLAVGAVAALGYAQIFYLLPISLFGMSVAAAELPELSRLDHIDQEAVGAGLNEALARIAFFVVPSIIAYVVLGDLVVGALLKTGRFGADDTRLVWYVLIAYSIGLLAATSSRLLQSALYAAGDARAPAAVAAVRVVVVVVLGIVLMFQLERVEIIGPGLDGLAGMADLPAPLRPLPEMVRSGGGPLRGGTAGLALASAVGAWIEFGILRRRLQAGSGGVIKVGGGWLGRLAVAGGVASAVALGLRAVVADLHPLAAAPIAAVPAVGAYLVAAQWVGVPEASAVISAVRRRVRR
ncbi:MAG: murein biosynthesis integral membrane protein MurJ, partial [Actinomycetota bacterium]|nr:murein biosynthesis integral membrane protein MurJ [Actinomycetota bacterium]